MARIDFIQSLHSSSRRNYIQRVVDHDKASCATVAGRFGADYWDGDRCHGYGGYHYDGRWRPVAERLAAHYGLRSGDRVLDIGCGKGYLLYELTQAVPGIEVTGIDISTYGIEHAKEEVRPFLQVGDCRTLPYSGASFDVVISLGTFHNLPLEGAWQALREMQRVGRGLRKYFMVESFRTEEEKVNLLYWQLTCLSFHSPESWAWLAAQVGYDGDHGFIFFE
jgi:SAM-dependent methyltransferase